MTFLAVMSFPASFSDMKVPLKKERHSCVYSLRLVLCDFCAWLIDLSNQWIVKTSNPIGRNLPQWPNFALFLWCLCTDPRQVSLQAININGVIWVFERKFKLCGKCFMSFHKKQFRCFVVKRDKILCHQITNLVVCTWSISSHLTI